MQEMYLQMVCLLSACTCEETWECDWPSNALKSLRKFNLRLLASPSVQVLRFSTPFKISSNGLERFHADQIGVLKQYKMFSRTHFTNEKTAKNTNISSVTLIETALSKLNMFA